MIEQFEEKPLSHFSYAVLDKAKSAVALIDPARDVAPYLAFAEKHKAKITAVIETHPHADFVSGHLELLRKTGATIYCSHLQQVEYPHTPFDEEDTIVVGDLALRALNTPGHSPDSICVVLSQKEKDVAVFTGDTLFIGDCGRPDLREDTGNVSAKRDELARQMYHSLRDKLAVLDDQVIVYPAHGSGSLCGKSLSKASESTIGAEKETNWSLQEMREEEFVKNLTTDQPFVPKYFGYAVSLNRTGAPDLEPALEAVKRTTQPSNVAEFEGTIIIDARKQGDYKKEHLPNSVNIQNETKFETWLGSIVAPRESFHLAAADEKSLEELIARAAKIGYEPFIQLAFVFERGSDHMDKLDVKAFKETPEAYTIVDVRNPTEVKEHPVFKGAISIPLFELRERAGEIPEEKPVVVHCAAGYRSAAGSSIVADAKAGRAEVFDLGEDIKAFV